MDLKELIQAFENIKKAEKIEEKVDFLLKYEESENFKSIIKILYDNRIPAVNKASLSSNVMDKTKVEYVLEFNGKTKPKEKDTENDENDVSCECLPRHKYYVGGSSLLKHDLSELIDNIEKNPCQALAEEIVFIIKASLSYVNKSKKAATVDPVKANFLIDVFSKNIDLGIPFSEILETFPDTVFPFISQKTGSYKKNKDKLSENKFLATLNYKGEKWSRCSITKTSRGVFIQIADGRKMVKNDNVCVKLLFNSFWDIPLESYTILGYLKQEMYHANIVCYDLLTNKDAMEGKSSIPYYKRFMTLSEIILPVMEKCKDISLMSPLYVGEDEKEIEKISKDNNSDLLLFDLNATFEDKSTKNIYKYTK